MIDQYQMTLTLQWHCDIDTPMSSKCYHVLDYSLYIVFPQQKNNINEKPKGSQPNYTQNLMTKDKYYLRCEVPYLTEK